MTADSLKDSIQIEFKETAPCAQEASVKIPATEVEKTFNNIVKEISREVQIQGFRKGKVPPALVKARFSQNIVEDTAKHLQNAAIEKIQSELDLVAVTALDDGKVMPATDKEYTFKASIETAPKFELPDYKAMSIEVAKGEDAEKQIAERLASLKDIYADDIKVETESLAGDMLKVSYESDFQPAEDASPSLKRTVKVNEVQRKQPVEDDAKLAEKLHVESVEKLHEDLKKSIEFKIENDRKNAAREKVLDLLLAKAGAFDLPKSIVEGETEREFTKLANQLVRSEADVEKFKAEKEKHLETAIAEAEKIEVSKNEFDAQIKSMSSYFGYKEKDVVKAIRRNGAIGEIHADLLTGKVLDFIVDKADIKEV